MLKFTPLNKNVLDIKKYLKASKMNFCDFTLAVKYMWAEEVKVDYAIYNDTLIAKESTNRQKNAFYFPIGNDVLGALEKIEEYVKVNGLTLKFTSIDEETAEFLQSRYYLTKKNFHREWCDYIYIAEDLKYFKGKKFSGQRNHLNKFKKACPNYVFKPITKADINRVKEFCKEYALTKDLSSYYAKKELEKAYDFIDVMFDLDQVGGIIEVDGKIVAISIGEVLGDTLVIQIEKGLKDYPGVYQAMVSEFAKAYATDGITYINREEDCGDEGLRTSKMQYHPIEIKAKNIVTVETLFDRIKEPFITTERLTISDAEKEDMPFYTTLAMDEERNKYWGYDYKTDLDGKTPNEEYFYEFVNGLKTRKEEYPFAIRLNGKMIGEAVLYNFDFFGKAETGIRIAKEFSGLGFGLEALKALKEYAIKVLGAKRLTSKCYKENKASFNMLTKSGYKQVSEDETHYYFEEEIKE